MRRGPRNATYGECGVLLAKPGLEGLFLITLLVLLLLSSESVGDGTLIL